MIGPFSAALIVVAASFTGLATGIALATIWLPTFTDMCVGALLLGVIAAS